MSFTGVSGIQAACRVMQEQMDAIIMLAGGPNTVGGVVTARNQLAEVLSTVQKLSLLLENAQDTVDAN